MAHNVETMAYNKVETPWHGLGFPVSNDLTVDEMMKAAKVDWTVSVHPLFASYNNNLIDCGKKRALVRDSDQSILDIISDDWNPTQNAEAFDFFREYIEAGNMNMETAGSLNNGKNVWALASINESFEAVKGDIVGGYLLFSNPHRYGAAINVRHTTIRVVCNNTLTYALSKSSAHSVNINHSRKFDAEAVKNELGIARHQMNENKEMSIFLASKKFNQDSLKDFVKSVFPSSSDKREISRPAQVVLDAINTQPGAEFAPGSWWQALNAVTYSTDHLLGHKQDTRLNSAWFGANDKRKTFALQQALEMANAS